jgi:hypothetical protein
MHTWYLKAPFVRYPRLKTWTCSWGEGLLLKLTSEIAHTCGAAGIEDLHLITVRHHSDAIPLICREDVRWWVQSSMQSERFQSATPRLNDGGVLLQAPMLTSPLSAAGREEPFMGSSPSSDSGMAFPVPDPPIQVLNRRTGKQSQCIWKMAAHEPGRGKHNRPGALAPGCAAPLPGSPKGV